MTMRPDLDTAPHHREPGTWSLHRTGLSELGDARVAYNLLKISNVTAAKLKVGKYSVALLPPGKCGLLTSHI